MKAISRITYSLLFLLLLQATKAEVVSSIQNGFWQSPTTWSSNAVPQATDTILVDHYVQIIDTIFIDPTGQLTIDSCGILCGDACFNGHFTNYGNMYIGCFILNADSYNYDTIFSNNTGGSGLVAGGFMQSFGYINVGPNMPPCVLPSNKTEAVGSCQRIVSGITEADAIPAFSIYPNPAHETVTISFSSEKNPITIALYSLTGQYLRIIKDTAGANTTINIKDIPTGFYFLQINNGENTTVKSLAISR